MAIVAVVSAWWWSRQLDRLMVEPSELHGGRIDGGAGNLAILSGVRKVLPGSAGGAAAARELIYLVRSPGRRAALLAGTVLGLVYVAFFVAAGDGADSWLVLAAPVSMLFALQYASNQLGVDPGGFWMEVAAGPPPGARWVNRQLLGCIAVMLPVVVAAVILAIWTGGWIEFAVVMITMSSATLSMVGVGSLLSPLFVTPVPDSGNPFGSRQAMSGTGCSAAIVGMLYLLLVGLLVVPAEFALRWAWRSASPFVAVAVGVGVVGLNLALWWGSTRAAVRQLPEKELEVLARLDPRLNV